MNSDTRLSGLVLAGGRSARMGVDKATLVHPDGRSLVIRCRDLLLEAGCDPVVISLRHDQEIPAGLEESEIVRDPEGASGGPMVGIVSGMRLRPASDWLVLACDLPRLDVETLTNLVVSKLSEEKFLSYSSEFDGLPEPLCALYAQDALPILEQAQGDGFHCPRKILIRHGCRLLESVTPRALDNANTPEDWEAATAIEETVLQGDVQAARTLTDRPESDLPVMTAELLEIWISSGNDFKGRHGLGRLEHGIQNVPDVECVAGMGLQGDRYFGYKPEFKGQVTFFSAEVVESIREHCSQPHLSSSVFRRNLIVKGVNLGEWNGRRFVFQGIDFEGTEECKPCYWMDEAVAPGTEALLSNRCRGGLRARILTDGVLRVSTTEQASGRK